MALDDGDYTLFDKRLDSISVNLARIAEALELIADSVEWNDQEEAKEEPKRIEE